MTNAIWPNRIGRLFLSATGAASLGIAAHAPSFARNANPVATISVSLEDIDLSSDKGRMARDYRIAASAAVACDGGDGQRSLQFRSCVQLAIKAGRRQCTQDEDHCLIPIDRHASGSTSPRPNYGPRPIN